MSDNEISLIQAVQSGHTDAFAVFYERYVDQLYAFIYYKTHHRETAQDLTSKTFLKALKGINSLKATENSFRPWLYTIARNNVIDHYRTHHKSSDIADAWDLADDQDVARDAELRASLVNVQKYLSDIDPVQRDIILLRIWQDMPYEEISKIVGKSPDNCKVIFSRAIRRLRTELAVLLALALIRLHM